MKIHFVKLSFVNDSDTQATVSDTCVLAVYDNVLCRWRMFGNVNENKVIEWQTLLCAEDNVLVALIHRSSNSNAVNNTWMYIHETITSKIVVIFAKNEISLLSNLDIYINNASLNVLVIN